jgi:hypothetical protein
MAALIIHLYIGYGKWWASRSTLLPEKALPTFCECEAGILGKPGSQVERFGESKISCRTTAISNLPNTTYILNNFRNNVDRHGTVDIATRYGLDGPGIEFRLGRAFPHLSRETLEHTQPPGLWLPGLFFEEVKWPGPSVEHPPSSSVEVKERVDMYSPCGPTWPALGWNLPCTISMLPVPVAARSNA